MTNTGAWEIATRSDRAIAPERGVNRSYAEPAGVPASLQVGEVE
jgi:hypothetical protein